VDLSVTYLLVF